MREIEISHNEENQRLDKFLLKYLNKASKSFIYKMIRKKNIKINGKKGEGNEILSQGDKISLFLSDETIESFMEHRKISISAGKIDVVYEDINILMCSKPVGVLSQKERSDDKDNMVDRIIYYLYKTGSIDMGVGSTFVPGIVNRLDRNTSGIIVSGKNLSAAQWLNEAFSLRLVDKYYITIVKGDIKNSGEIKGYHTKCNDENIVSISNVHTEGAKRTSTMYKPLKWGGGYTLLQLKLITGKAHQIRAHLQSIGHPIVGDRKYGNENVNKMFRNKYGLKNQLLHGEKMMFKHVTKKFGYICGETITCALPDYFQNIVDDIF